MFQNNNVMVQIESYSLSKTVELPFINPRYFFIIYFQWYEDQIWPKIVRVDTSDVATTIEITSTIEIIISIMVENEFKT